jgi:predicted nucleic acid-binding Zn ribbon protein
MAERVVQHKHCRTCRKAVPPEKDFCDETCEGQYKAELKKKRNNYIILLLLAMLVMFMALFLQ